MKTHRCSVSVVKFSAFSPGELSAFVPQGGPDPSEFSRSTSVILDLRPPLGRSVGMGVYRGELYWFMEANAVPTEQDQEMWQALTGQRLPWQEDGEDPALLLLARQDANRAILALLAEQIEQHPQWRFGQLLMNTGVLQGQYTPEGWTFADPFSEESTTILRRMNEDVGK